MPDTMYQWVRFPYAGYKIEFKKNAGPLCSGPAFYILLVPSYAPPSLHFCSTSQDLPLWRRK